MRCHIQTGANSVLCKNSAEFHQHAILMDQSGFNRTYIRNSGGVIIEMMFCQWAQMFRTNIIIQFIKTEYKKVSATRVHQPTQFRHLLPII